MMSLVSRLVRRGNLPLEVHDDRAVHPHRDLGSERQREVCSYELDRLIGDPSKEITSIAPQASGRFSVTWSERHRKG